MLKTSDTGGVVHFNDVVRETRCDADGRVIDKGIELGAKNYDVNSYLDGEPSTTLAVFQLPGSNALDTAAAIRAKMEELKASRFPRASTIAFTMTRPCLLKSRSTASFIR